MINIKIENILHNKDKSIYWLANKTSLTYPTLYKIANSKNNNVQINTLEKIMSALNITDFNKILEIIPGEEE